MNSPHKPPPGKKEPSKRKASHSEEALRIIEEYASTLRETIKKLRRKLN